MPLDPKTEVIFFIWMLGFLSSSSALAESSPQPYIDQIKRELKQYSPKGGGSGPHSGTAYIDAIKKDLESKNPPGQDQKSYIEELRASDPMGLTPKKSEGSYTEKIKQKLEPQEEGGAIQAVVEGRSELHPKKPGNIKQGFSIRYTATATRNYTGDPGVQARSFNSVYGSNYAPDMSLLYEYQPFRSEWYGNIGIFGMGGVGYFHSTGAFAFPPLKPNGAGTFPVETKTKFQFFTIPVTVGVNYRFSLFKVIRPYVMVGPTIIGYLENRNDQIKGTRGNSRGILTTVGAALKLDWMFPGNSWDLFQNYGFQHTYLTVDFTRVSTYSGPIDFSSSSFIAGFLFEL